MYRFSMLVAGVILGVPAIVGAAAGAGAQKADPAVVKIRDAYVAASHARDAAKVAELYHEDAVELPPYQQPAKGRAAIRAYYEQQFKGDQVAVSNLQLQSLESRVSGDLAYDVGTYRQTITPKGAKATEDSGNYTVIMRRGGDGQWRVAYAIYNSHRPPAGGGMQ